MEKTTQNRLKALSGGGQAARTQPPPSHCRKVLALFNLEWPKCEAVKTQMNRALTSLDLSDNYIVTLPMNILHKMKHLKHLHLQVF